MSWLFEETLPIIFIAVLAEAILFGALVHTGRRFIIFVMLAVLGLLGASLLIERIVVTDREAVVATLEQIARDLEKNNTSALAAHIASTAPSLQHRIQTRLARVEVKTADVKGRPDVTLYSQGSVRFAEADIKGLVVGNDRKGLLQDVRYFRRFLIRFRNEGGTWKVYEYEEQSPL